MREVIARVHPISVHGAEVLDLQLDKGASEIFGVTELDGKIVWQQCQYCQLTSLALESVTSLELEFSAQNVHQ